MDGCGIRCLGHGDVFGAILDVFGLGGHAGCICTVCISQVFRVQSLSAYLSLCLSSVRSSEGPNIKTIEFKSVPIVRTTTAVSATHTTVSRIQTTHETDISYGKMYIS
jgi:hypothetical protein